MKKLLHLTLCLLFITLTQCDDSVNIEPQPNVTIIVPTSPTKAPPTTPPTTAKPAPTPEPSTTTTTTTTTKPTTKTTTTPPPTTTTTTTTTTTPPTPTTTPTTSTTAVPVTTPAPKKDIGTWHLNYTGTNETCIIMKMELELRVQYNKTDNKTGNATIIVPPKAKTSGDCGDGKKPQNITLTWDSFNGTLDSITFSFARSNTTKQFMLASIKTNISVDKNHFPNATNNNTISASLVTDEFITPLDMSYRCMKEETLKFPNSTVEFVVSNMQIQAFFNTTKMEFSTAEDCEARQTPGIVPIAVGCSLAALIIIVLIAFLIGRRRTQVRGYLSMFSETKKEEEYIPMKNLSCFGK